MLVIDLNVLYPKFSVYTARSVRKLENQSFVLVQMSFLARVKFGLFVSI